MYKEYFQKSKVFLYPLLGIPKGQKFVPVGTYLAWEDEIDFSDMKFMCLYKQRESKAFYKFEDKYLLGNILFDDYQKLSKTMHLYIFDFTKFPNDWRAIMNGRYSKFTDRSKKIITDFFEGSGKVTEYIESYIYPDYYHEDVAEDLAVTLELLQKVYELCDKPNLEKETLKLKAPEARLFRNNNISLQSNLKEKTNGKKSNTSSNRENNDGNNIKLGSKQDL